MNAVGFNFDEVQTLADADALDEQARSLRQAGNSIETVTDDVNAAWGRLEYHYVAPETDILLSALRPAVRRAEKIKSDIGKIADAFETYADTERELKKRLDEKISELKRINEDVSGDDDWHKNEELVNKVNGLKSDYNGILEEHAQAQNTCATKISSIFGGPRYELTPNDGSTAGGGVRYYGASQDVLNSAMGAGELPWATVSEYDKPWYEDAWDTVNNFGGGLWESLKGTFTGTLALVNPFDWDTFSSSWKGIATLTVDVVTVATPLGLLRSDSERAESGERLKMVGESLINLEEWKNNPAKAAGMLTGDLLTMVGTGGVGVGFKTASTAGKAGKAANAVGDLSKAGKSANSVDLTKALAQTRLGKVSIDAAGYMRDSKAIYGRALADMRTNIGKAGYAVLDKSIPQAANAVKTVQRFQTYSRNVVGAAWDTASDVRDRTMGRPQFAGVPDSGGRGGPGGVMDTFRDSLDQRQAASVHAHEGVTASVVDGQSGSASKGGSSGGGSAGDDGVTLKLRPKEQWDEYQKIQYRGKVDHLDGEAREGKLEYTKDYDRGKSLRAQMIKNPEEAIDLGLPDGIDVEEFRNSSVRHRKAMLAQYDLDHKTDLQLGGEDDATNMQWLDRSVNRSVGSQINNQYMKNKWNDLLKNTSHENVRVSRVEG